MDKPYRVRFAPSPTGSLHVGGARTALFNYLLAKRKAGSFIIRVEDTDLARSSDDSIRSILKDLAWMGLSWDEGPNLDLSEKGNYGPYRQSDRKDIYLDHAKKLIDLGKAYYCFLSDDASDDDFKNSIYRDLSLDDALVKIANGDVATIRFKVPVDKKDYTFFDDVRGKITLPSTMVGDFVLIRSNGMPTYNFACAVDDHLMEISHVYRAEEHLNNTLRQLMIYEAFNWSPPKFGHMSLILGPDRQKLSKRHGATSLSDFAAKGYLPMALINYLSLLGWSSPKTNQEVIDLNELENVFSVKRINDSPAVFDPAKLDWLNRIYLNKYTPAEVYSKIDLSGKTFTVPVDDYFINNAINLFKVAVHKLSDYGDLFNLLVSRTIDYTDEGVEVLNWATSKGVLSKAVDLIPSGEGAMSGEDFDKLIATLKDLNLGTGKEIFWSLRVALIGSPHGPEIKTLVTLMSRDEVLMRLNKALVSIKS